MALLKPRPTNKRQVLAWAVYDWANSAFATAVIAGFFPVFFKQFWSAGSDVMVSSFRLGVANSTASLIVLMLAPVLGAMADQGVLKKRFLSIFVTLGVATTAGLYFIGKGSWQAAATCYVLAGIGFAGANIFYDALILNVTEKRHLDVVSGLGFALGYLGGGLFFAFCVAMSRWPQAFGFADNADAVRLSFVLTACWWAVFTLPLLRFVKEHPLDVRVRPKNVIAGGFRQLKSTLQRVRRFRVTGLFLLAYWLYIDGVDTIVRMAVDYGMALGFPAESLVTALLITQFVGFPAAIAFGWLGQRLGPKRGILIGLCVYMLITLWGYWLRHTWEFYAIAIAIGLVQGGVQSLSRSLYARLIPPHAAAEFFGFYNLLGKFAAILGPAMMGWVSLATGNTRLSILSLLILFIAGAGILCLVDERAALQER